MANRYKFACQLEGFIRLGEPGGKYNNCGFSFKLPPAILEQAEKDRVELLKWAKTKVPNPNRVALNPPKWDDEGLVKYSFDGETGRSCLFVDTKGKPIDKSVLKTVAKGTKVNIIVDQKPYTKPALGTTLKVLGVQIVELQTFGGAADSGELSEDDVANLFGTCDGFDSDSPQVREASGGDEPDF